MKEERGINLHLKIDETFLNLLSDYHNVSPLECVNYFHNIMKDMIKNDGNVVNKERRAVKARMKNKNGQWVQGWKTEKNTAGFAGSTDYDAYAFRGFYPGSKVPFKMSGVKQGGHYGGFACFVVVIGDKNNVAKFNGKKLELIEQTLAESILLDKKPDELNEEIYKQKSFRCMTPKGIERHGKHNG